MIKRLVYALMSCVVLCAGGQARAQTLLFSESWEGSTSAWTTDDGNPITVVSESTPCSTNFQRETIRYSGGRIFLNSPIPVTGSGNYCLSAWMRAVPGASPYLAIYLATSGGAHIGDPHNLVGNPAIDNGYGGSSVLAATDGNWHWYAAPFTVESIASYIQITDELYLGGNSGPADFDDISFWSGSCPTSPPGVDAHSTCGGGTPACSSAGACVLCTTSNTSACASDPNGQACEGSGSPFCGCGGDGDCPSGSLCNLSTNLCFLPDLLAPPDLTQLPDLSRLPDLSQLPDLSAPPDLMNAPDLASPPPDLSTPLMDLSTTEPTDLMSMDLSGKRRDLSAADDLSLSMMSPPDLGAGPDLSTIVFTGGGCACGVAGRDPERGQIALWMLVVASALFVRRRRSA